MSQEELSSSAEGRDSGEGKKSCTTAKFFMLAAILSVLFVTVLMLWGGRDELRKVKPGYPAPDFIFRDLNHKEVSLSDYKGKVVLLNLWSITCPPCIEEVPQIESLYQQMKGVEDFHLLTVVTNRGETEKEVRPFVEKHGIHFQVLIDNKKIAWKKYKLTGWPETFLIDREGIIVEKFIGPKEWASREMINKLTALVEKKNG